MIIKLIDKDALVAEIERLCDEKGTFYADYVLWCLKEYLNTLEVKEVDLEEVFNNEYSKFSNDTDAMNYGFPIDLAGYKDFAKHFFELGLKTKQE